MPGEHHFVNQGSLSVVNVCNNRNVSNLLHIRFFSLFTQKRGKVTEKQRNNQRK
jgi:hypothetical protein